MAPGGRDARVVSGSGERAKVEAAYAAILETILCSKRSLRA